jgi:hypothetical protein
MMKAIEEDLPGGFARVGGDVVDGGVQPGNATQLIIGRKELELGRGGPDGEHIPKRYRPSAELSPKTTPVRHGQPTSGMTRWIGQVKLMAISPGINLRNRFDTYGVDVNNSSIALKARRFS